MTGVPFPLLQAELAFEAAGGTTVRRSVLPSGVRVLTESVPGSRSATIGLWVAVGSRDEHASDSEHPARYGSTHFLEHLLFKGTPTRSALDIAVAFDAVGGEHNAVTAKEHTCYFAKVQDRDVPMAITVLADMVTASLLDPKEFETERGVILEELAMADDDPGDVVGEWFARGVFGDHPLGRPIGGTPDTIRAATRDAVNAHYRATYLPGELVVTAAGAIDHDVLVRDLSAALGPWAAAAGTPAPRRPRGTTSVTGSSLTVVSRPLEQVNLMVGTPGLALGDPRRFAFSVFTSIFGGGMSSRLFQEVRERRGLAYAVYSFGQSYSDAGLFGMAAGCTPARTAEVAGLMWAELERVATDGVTDDEVRRAQGQLSGSAALALEDSDTRMSRLGRAELGTGDFVDLDVLTAAWDRVTAAEVRALAADLASCPRAVAAVGAVTEDTLAAAVGD